MTSDICVFLSTLAVSVISWIFLVAGWCHDPELCAGAVPHGEGMDLFNTCTQRLFPTHE